MSSKDKATAPASSKAAPKNTVFGNVASKFSSSQPSSFKNASGSETLQPINIVGGQKSTSTEIRPQKLSPPTADALFRAAWADSDADSDADDEKEAHPTNEETGFAR